MHGTDAPAPRGVERLARDPIARFALFGALLFAVDRFAVGAPDDAGDGAAPPVDRIVIDERFVDGLRARHRERVGREPTGAEVDELVREFVREEALYREAVERGLDAGDVIVRRRLVQKAELALSAEVEVDEPSEAELERWAREHADALAVPARTSFVHVFFSRDQRGDRAEADAREALVALGARGEGAGEGLGDAFTHGSAVGPLPGARIDAMMAAPFAAAIAAAPEHAWSGPYESAYGVHVVYVREREPERAPRLDEVHDRVRGEWLEEERARAVRAAIDETVGRYAVVREGERG